MTYRVMDDNGCLNWVRDGANDEIKFDTAGNLARRWMANAPDLVCGQIRIIRCNEAGRPQ